jgi:hypothetical protein
VLFGFRSASFRSTESRRRTVGAIRGHFRTPFAPRNGPVKRRKSEGPAGLQGLLSSGGDSNPRPSGYEPDGFTSSQVSSALQRMARSAEFGWRPLRMPPQLPPRIRRPSSAPGRGRSLLVQGGHIRPIADTPASARRRERGRVHAATSRHRADVDLCLTPGWPPRAGDPAWTRQATLRSGERFISPARWRVARDRRREDRPLRALPQTASRRSTSARPQPHVTRRPAARPPTRRSSGAAAKPTTVATGCSRITRRAR